MDPQLYAILPVAILGAFLTVFGLYFARKERREHRSREQDRSKLGSRTTQN